MVSQVEPNFDSLESKHIVNYFNSNGWAAENKVTRDFEKKIASYVGMEFAVAISKWKLVAYI